MPSPIEGLYAVTQEEADDAVLERKVVAAMRGGAGMVQYRNKTGSMEFRARQLQRLAPVCRRHGARLIVNDSVELAREVRADGVHLGRDDGEVAAARRVLGASVLIGVSCYDDLQRAHAAVRDGADYVAFGSFFASTTKPGAVRASLDLLRQARQALDLPIVAIGGITVANGASLIAAGADALAVASALFGAADAQLPDVEAQARRFARLFPVTSASAAQR
jgi:thiamine-phosphate pyrophosphorylase